MIVLFNLNHYLGGGETILVRFAEHLKKNSRDYLIISCCSKSYISTHSLKNNLKNIYWPIKEDSVVYMNVSEKIILQEFAFKYFNESNGTIYLFTFCLRDFYNSLYIAKTLKLKNLKICHGIYHPEDYLYLSNFTFFKKRLIDVNLRYLNYMNEKHGLIFSTSNSYDLISTKFDTSQKLIIPIPIVLDSLSITKSEISNKVKFICISRFVSFKIASIIAMLNYIRKNKNFELSIVGYGKYKFLIHWYIFFFRIKNVKIYSKIDPDKLHSLIDIHDIGYAQGTSILEIAKRGKPVIIAPYSHLFDIFKRNFMSYGIFGFSNEIEFGDSTEIKSYSKPIDEAANIILENYDLAVSLTFNFIKEFNSEVIFQRLYNSIQNSRFAYDSVPIIIFPKPPIIKRVLRNLIMFTRSKTLH